MDGAQAPRPLVRRRSVSRSTTSRIQGGRSPRGGSPAAWRGQGEEGGGSAARRAGETAFLVDELREALAGLDVVLVLPGAEHEGAEFWRGVEIERRKPGPGLLAGVSAVVLPALVEHNPRALLRAVAAGVPVIASRECGIPRRPGVATVPVGDASALRAALEDLLFGTPAPLAARVA